jgi:uncharacterized membrane protein YhdT
LSLKLLCVWAHIAKLIGSVSKLIEIVEYWFRDSCFYVLLTRIVCLGSVRGIYDRKALWTSVKQIF